MAEKIQCSVHGESRTTYVCIHLTGGTAGLGFNRNEPTKENPFPDAWCDDCEIIRAANDGWNKKSEELASISILCAGCYERARIRNERKGVTLNDLKNLRWKCKSCEDWHTEPCLDFSHDSPAYWRKEHQKTDERDRARRGWDRQKAATFLDDDYCAIEDRDFFARGLIHLPIIGTDETLRWGVWGSLSRENFKTLLKMHEDPKRVDLQPMFSWLSNNIPEYPKTLSLKMYAHVLEPGECPWFELEPTDHPLSQEYHHGIEAKRVMEIVKRQLGVA